MAVGRYCLRAVDRGWADGMAMVDSRRRPTDIARSWLEEVDWRREVDGQLVVDARSSAGRGAGQRNCSSARSDWPASVGEVH